MLRQAFEGLRAGAFAALFIATVLLIPTGLLAQNPAIVDPAGVFVEINADIEILEWSAGLSDGNSPRPQSFQIHAVVGRNKWVIGESYSGQTNYYSFDGAKIVEWGCSVGTNGSTGNLRTWSSTSPDGNPSETIRASDHMGMGSRIAWLAFCSPATLNNPKHKLYPPWEFWKEYLDPSKFTEKVDRFKDDLGLPKSLLVISDERQPIVDYRVSGTTNVAGWLFPQSFYLLEYNPNGIRGWMLKLLAHGRVSTIAPAAVPFASDTAAHVDHEIEVKRQAEIPTSLLK